MKRHGNLYPQVISRAALYQAYLDARKTKRATRACFQFERRLAAQIENLHQTLSDGSYQPKPYYKFMVYEPKPREISAPAFRDRVVQHAIYNLIRPLFDAVFIEQSYACRLGKGTHAASDYAQAALNRVPADSYILQLDIRRYYYRLDRAVLQRLIERKIKDRRLVALIMQFAITDDYRGVPIGNLLSQLFGLIYLDALDRFVKRELKVKHYARYVDDFVLFGLSREQAISHKARIVEFLDKELHLELSKSSIHKAHRGLNFVGYRTWRTRRFVRKRNLYNYRQSVKRGRLESVISSLGHARQTASRQYMLNYLQENNHELYRQLPQKIQSLHRHPAQRPRGRQRAVHPGRRNLCVDPGRYLFA
ncbi:reverse transcriptase domain-containing protein [Oceanisphaera arctica]|uniref:Reverse transcriptase domain-containing protein n=1 Tax=Oceanisphaera arctica TaxID=641510 RepID=A0A2P5THR6_9GAMM|nr:reverse transcriptase domain-containing protein [Oceanisphaera arctica]PPL14069.1 hypothetical protein UN63_16740 [Oceanisphaera arctica]GHA05498.1 hypothetical protein GCM10007082_03050 [Oceanisphaera arctica]